MRTTDSTPTAPAQWHRHALDAWRQLRQVRAERDLALDLIAGIMQRHHQLRERHRDTRAQLRALMRGTTVEQEKLILARVLLEPEYEAIEAARALCGTKTDPHSQRKIRFGRWQRAEVVA